MKKILIFYSSYGGGHLSAAKSIKECIEANYNDIEVKMVDCIEYINKYVNKISTLAYAEMAKNAPWAWKRVYSDSQKGPLATISTTSNKIMSHRLNHLIQDFQPDLIISTHPFSSQMCAILKKRGHITSKLATIMTDYVPHNQWVVGSEYTDYFFVAHEGMKNELITLGVDENKIFATGIPLSSRFLQSYDRDTVFKSLNLCPDKKTILFFAGGEFGLGRNTTYMVLKAIIRLFKDFQVIAIAGRNKKMQDKFDELVSLTNSKDRIKVLSYTNQVPEFMSISDMVITKPGGLTITESLSASLPIIIINPIPGQEEENAQFLVDNNVAIWIKKGDNIARSLKNLFRNPDKIENMRLNSGNLSKKNSTSDICKILLQN